jgi:uncharacterized protein (DUF433 family)
MITEPSMAEPRFQSIEPTVPTEIVSDARILGGMPVLSGTRIPAETIAAYLRAGQTSADIRADYPTLPADGITIVEAWAAATG